MENITRKLEEGIEAVLKEYYPEQLTSTEFKMAIYKEFKNKDLAAFVIEKN